MNDVARPRRLSSSSWAWRNQKEFHFHFVPLCMPDSFLMGPTVRRKCRNRRKEIVKNIFYSLHSLNLPGVQYTLNTNNVFGELLDGITANILRWDYTRFNRSIFQGFVGAHRYSFLSICFQGIKNLHIKLLNRDRIKVSRVPLWLSMISCE